MTAQDTRVTSRKDLSAMAMTGRASISEVLIMERHCVLLPLPVISWLTRRKCKPKWKLS